MTRRLCEPVAERAEHGWFWLNISEQPVTVTLSLNGYYDKLIDYGVANSSSGSASGSK